MYSYIVEVAVLILPTVASIMFSKVPNVALVPTTNGLRVAVCPVIFTIVLGVICPYTADAPRKTKVQKNSLLAILKMLRQ